MGRSGSAGKAVVEVKSEPVCYDFPPGFQRRSQPPSIDLGPISPPPPPALNEPKPEELDDYAERMVGSSRQIREREKGRGRSRCHTRKGYLEELSHRRLILGSHPASMSSYPTGSFSQYHTGVRPNGTFTSQMMGLFEAPTPLSFSQYDVGARQSGPSTAQLMGAGSQFEGMMMQSSSWPQFGSSAPLFSESMAGFAVGGTADGLMRPSLPAFGTKTGVAMAMPQVHMTGSTDVPSSEGSQGSGSRAQLAEELDEDNGDDSDSDEDGGIARVAVQRQSKAREPPTNPTDREVLHMFYDGTIENPTAVSTIATNLRNMMQGPYFTYGMWPEEDKAMCWNRFKHTYQWDPSIKNAVYRWYDRVATARFAGSVNHAKQWWMKCEEDPTHSLTHGCWVHKDFRPAFIAYWKLEATDKKSKQNAKNRDKGKTVNYRGGSRSTNKHRIDLANKRKIAPKDVPFQDVFVKTRAKTHNDGTVEWKNPEDKQYCDAYLEHCLREYGPNTSLWPPWDVKQWVHIVGRSKKNRVSGLATYGEPECIGHKARKHSRFFEIGSSSLDSLRSQYQKLQADSNAMFQSQANEISSLKNVVAFLAGKLNMSVPEEVWRPQQQQFNNFPATFFQPTQPTYTNLGTGPVSGDPLFQSGPQSAHQEDEGAGEKSAGGGANDTTNFGDM